MMQSALTSRYWEPSPEPASAGSLELMREGRDRFHVAIIMDGNGRWAAERGRPRAAGHVAGTKVVRRNGGVRA